MYSQRIEYQKVQNTSPKKAQDTTFHNVRHFNEKSQSKVKYKSENSKMACGIWCKIQRIKASILQQHLICCLLNINTLTNQSPLKIYPTNDR